MNKEYLLRMPKELHAALKMKALVEETTMQELIIKAIEENIKLEVKK